MDILRLIFLPITAPLDFLQKYFKSLVFIVILIVLFGSSGQNLQSNENLYKISLVGPIIDSEQTLQEIDKAIENNSIKGVLFVVNSPGGAVAPSIEISYAIKRLQAIKPIVTYSNGVLASGSYYASIWSDKIIANPGAIIGSIGVIMQGADISKLLDNIGIKPQTVKIGKYKEAGTFVRAWNKDEIKEINKVIKSTYNTFVEDVANARGLDAKKSYNFANAHIFTAKEAKRVGLIDSVGTIYDAKQQLIKLTKVKNPIWNKENKIDKLYDKFLQNTISSLFVYFNTTLKTELNYN